MENLPTFRPLYILKSGTSKETAMKKGVTLSIDHSTAGIDKPTERTAVPQTIVLCAGCFGNISLGARGREELEKDPGTLFVCDPVCKGRYELGRYKRLDCHGPAPRVLVMTRL